jgi:hypothetical protein
MTGADFWCFENHTPSPHPGRARISDRRPNGVCNIQNKSPRVRQEVYRRSSIRYVGHLIITRESGRNRTAVALTIVLSGNGPRAICGFLPDLTASVPSARWGCFSGLFCQTGGE